MNQHHYDLHRYLKERLWSLFRIDEATIQVSAERFIDQLTLEVPSLTSNIKPNGSIILTVPEANRVMFEQAFDNLLQDIRNR